MGERHVATWVKWLVTFKLEEKSSSLGKGGFWLSHVGLGELRGEAM